LSVGNERDLVHGSVAWKGTVIIIIIIITIIIIIIYFRFAEVRTTVPRNFVTQTEQSEEYLP